MYFIGCSDIWSNIILSVSLKVFLDDIKITILRWVKHIALSNVGGSFPVSWKFNRMKRLTLPWVKRRLCQLTISQSRHELALPRSAMKPGWIQHRSADPNQYTPVSENKCLVSHAPEMFWLLLCRNSWLIHIYVCLYWVDNITCITLGYKRFEKPPI